MFFLYYYIFFLKIHNLECPDRSYQFIEYVQSTLPSGINFSKIIDHLIDSCKDSGNYTFGPFDKRFIGNMTVEPVNTTEPVTKMSEIEICKLHICFLCTVHMSSFLTYTATFHVQHFTLDVLSDTTV